jgi:DNA polymerase III epsilon subunit-like protein
MAIFTPETPLGRDVQTILLEHTDGLTAAEIQWHLRREKGLHVNEANLHELLAHPRVFTSLSGGRYVLSGSQVDASSRPASDGTEALDSKEVSTKAADFGQPLIANLPYASHNFVVFDIETTGTDPEVDRIIQIAALKVINDHPVAMRNWYCSPGNREIPYTLQIKLGLAGDPDLKQRILSADPPDRVLHDFLEFIGDLPLVAFNARFDAGFIQHALGDRLLCNRVVDTLELAMLALPALPHHSLSDVADRLNISADNLAAEWVALDLQDTNISGHSISSATLHNAVTDVYVLYRVHRLLLGRLVDTSPPAYKLIRALLPEAFEERESFSGLDDEVLAPLRAECDWSPQATKIRPASIPISGEEILVRYLSSSGRAPRHGQLEMQKLTGEALSDSQYAVIEAPTGTGKTRASLTAAVG